MKPINFYKSKGGNLFYIELKSMFYVIDAHKCEILLVECELKDELELHLPATKGEVMMAYNSVISCINLFFD